MLQKVTLLLERCPVRWSNMEHSSKGGQYRCRLTAGSQWLGFSTRCRPRESAQHECARTESEPEPEEAVELCGDHSRFLWITAEPRVAARLGRGGYATVDARDNSR